VQFVMDRLDDLPIELPDDIADIAMRGEGPEQMDQNAVRVTVPSTSAVSTPRRPSLGDSLPRSGGEAFAGGKASRIERACRKRR